MKIFIFSAQQPEGFFVQVQSGNETNSNETTDQPPTLQPVMIDSLNSSPPHLTEILWIQSGKRFVLF